MKKLSEVHEGDMVLKYQVPPEDLDSLVSVKSDEDLKNMLEEYDRHENGATTPKLRTFLFPSHPVVVENFAVSLEAHAIEQRYIDAINGVIRTRRRLPPLKIAHPRASMSAFSSPDSVSPEGRMMDSNDGFSAMGKKKGLGMHRVRSSPSICSLNNLQNQQSPQPQNTGFMNQNQHRHHQYQNHQPRHSYQRYQLSSPQEHNGEHNGGHERVPYSSTGRPLMTSPGEMGRSSLSSYYFQGRHYMENGGIISPNQGYYEDRTAYSVPHSPRKAY